MADEQIEPVDDSAPPADSLVSVLIFNNRDHPSEITLYDGSITVLSPRQRVTVQGVPQVLPAGVMSLNQ